MDASLAAVFAFGICFAMAVDWLTARHARNRPNARVRFCQALLAQRGYQVLAYRPEGLSEDPVVASAMALMIKSGYLVTDSKNHLVGKALTLKAPDLTQAQPPSGDTHD